MATQAGSVPRSIRIAHVLFMDLVGFSKLSTTGQRDLIERLEGVVKKTRVFQSAKKKKDLISLPTGDGMALVFLHDPQAPARCALEISKALQGTDIQLRMGINSGPAYPREDVSRGENVVGAGINHAQRAMDCGGAGHILVTKATADNLLELDEWKNDLHDLGEYQVKHGVKLRLYNLYRDGLGNSERPAGSSENPEHYVRFLREEAKWIEIRGLHVGSQKASRVAIDKLYVPLVTSPDQPERDEKGLATRPNLRKVPLEKALKQHPRLVIIGDPGSGKSTFLKWIVFKHAEPALPILIRIAELAGHIRGSRDADNPAWLRHFLEAKSADHHWGLSEAYFDRQLAEGCLVLLDGLDEAPNQAERESMTRLLDKASKVYSKSRFVVTTRPQSYTRETVLVEFEQRRIADLDEGAMQTFLRQWSEALYGDNKPATDKHFTELWGAVSARTEIRRMAGNPVMLTALAVVHWHEKQLPELRAELYQSIIVWLSRARKTRPGRTSAPECVRLLARLALAMQDHPKGRQVQIPRREAAEALYPMAAHEAERFLDDEEVDSGIVVSRGREVRFWHLTFQEFLAAKALTGVPEATLHQRLKGKVFLPEWRETALLLAGLLSDEGIGIQKVDGLANALLDSAGAALTGKAKCVGLLGAIERDLRPYKYEVSDPGYAKALEAVQGIFDAEKSAGIEFNDRLEAAEALGQAGDRRLAEDNRITIDACKFRMGADKNDDAEAYEDELPSHEVSRNAYKIGKYPVTVEEYRRFVESDSFGGLQDPTEWEEQKLHPNRPVVGVSWHEAAAYCKWTGGRLLTEAEWERASRGVEGRRYPWGKNDPDATRANYGERGPGHPTPVGLYPLGATPEGICDIAGNIWEWVEDWSVPYNKSPQKNPTGQPKGTSRVVRGDARRPVVPAGRVSFRQRPGVRDDFIGFRCAWEV